MERRTVYVYGDESGGFKSEPFFLLGLVLTYNAARHHAYIDDLRDRFRYVRQFEYKKTDRLKVGIAKAVIDYFVECDDLRFQGIYIDTSRYDLRHYSKRYDRSGRGAELVSYNYRYKQVILHNVSDRDDVVVLLDSRSTAKEDNLAEYLRRKIGNIKDIQSVDSAKHNLIQLTDLLVGSVYGELTDTHHPIKREIVTHLRERLGISRLTDRPPGLARKFRMYKWSPPTRSQ